MKAMLAMSCFDSIVRRRATTTTMRWASGMLHVCDPDGKFFNAFTPDIL